MYLNLKLYQQNFSVYNEAKYLTERADCEKMMKRMDNHMFFSTTMCSVHKVHKVNHSHKTSTISLYKKLVHDVRYGSHKLLLKILFTYTADKMMIS
jgi:hypothetical protein